jgi:hypothetical protein
LTAVLGLPSEAFYVLLGAVVGVVASLVATWFKEWLDCRHLRKRVATLLRIEIRAQAAASLAIASLANLLRKETRQQPELDARRYLVKYIPPQPAVYPGLVSDIGALPFDKATAVVEFYGAIDRAITLTHTLAAKWEHLDVNARDRSSEGTLARRWQAVASRRAVAIRELRKITEDPSPEDALATCCSAERALGDAAEGGSPRFTPPESIN